MQSANFDLLDLVIKFLPGQNNIGAVVYEFIDAISIHDNIAKEIETCLNKLDIMKKEFRMRDKKQRKLKAMFKNLNSKPKDYLEFQELVQRNANDPERIKLLTDKKSKKVAEQELKRYEMLSPLCSKLVKLEEKLIKARKLKDKARKILILAEKEHTDLKNKEKDIASNISDDHIAADERKCSLFSLFPNVHPGAQLMLFNNEDVSHMIYEDILQTIKDASTKSITTAIKNSVTAKGEIVIPTAFTKPIQTAVFQKYEYQFDWTTMTWISLEHLRQANVCLEDLKSQAAEFVASAGRGDIEAVQKWLTQGYEVDATGYTELTALHTAAAACHIVIVNILCEAEADCNTRDQNMLTPVLSAVRSGCLEVVELLIEYGGDVNLQDSEKRGVEYYSLLSRNTDMIRRFIRKRNIDDVVAPQSHSTALHVATELVTDQVDVVSTLLSLGASIYKLNHQGMLSEIIAKEHGNKAVSSLLEKHRLMAPAQCIYTTKDKGMEVWIGKSITLQQEWLNRMDITRVICIVSTDDEALTQLPAEILSPPSQEQQSHATNKKFAHICVLDHYQPQSLDDDVEVNNIGDDEEIEGHRNYKNKNKITSSITSSFTSSYGIDDGDESEDEDESDSDKLLWQQITHHLPTIHSFTSHLFKSYREQHHNATDPLRLLICDYDSVSTITESMTKTSITNAVSLKSGSSAYDLAHNAIVTSGNNISPAIACAILLLSQHERVEHTLTTIKQLRPSVNLSTCMKKGVLKLQYDYDTRKSKRLDQKLRKTDILSCSF